LLSFFYFYQSNNWWQDMMLLHRLIHLIRLEAGGKVMLRLNNINLDKSPELIQPPKIDDNIVCVKLIPDMNDIISPDIIDVALSYSIAGIEVVLEIPFENRAEFENQQLASIISNGGWSFGLVLKLLSVLISSFVKLFLFLSIK
jgi:hypothetical protein